MAKVGRLIAMSAALAAMVCVSALAQEPGPIAGPVSNGNDQAINAAATPPLKSFTATGASTNAAVSGSDCPDLICANANVCACNTASGSAMSALLGSVAYSVEISADANSALRTGQQFNNTGDPPTFCDACSGLITLKFGKSNVNSANLETSGLICYTLHGQLVYTGAFTVFGGGGKYSSAFGGGTVAWTITTPATGGINNELVLNGLLAK